MKTASAPANSILQSALTNFDHACSLLQDRFDAGLLERLRRPVERIELTLCPMLEGRQLKTFRAYLVRHSDVLGPSKGGIRMSPTVTLDDTAGLAMEMTWKCALIGVPFGGGKSAIVADPSVLSPFDKELIIRSFARAAARHIDPLVYVPAPDLGTNERDMGHLKDNILVSHGHATTRGCYVTGKPVLLGGIPGRRQSTGYGVVHCIEAAAQEMDLEPGNLTAIVQGLGNVGLAAVEALDRLGVRVVGVADVNEARYDEEGFDVPELVGYMREYGTLLGYHAGRIVPQQELLRSRCDVLVPAAVANQITERNAGEIQARLIAEGANGPTTPEADRILRERGIEVIPDILANAGGVYVSYLEYSHETQQEQATEEEVMWSLRQRMLRTMAETHQLAKAKDWTMRDAAMYIAVGRVAETAVARGHLS